MIVRGGISTLVLLMILWGLYELSENSRWSVPIQLKELRIFPECANWQDQFQHYLEQHLSRWQYVSRKEWNQNLYTFLQQHVHIKKSHWQINSHGDLTLHIYRLRAVLSSLNHAVVLEDGAVWPTWRCPDPIWGQVVHDLSELPSHSLKQLLFWLDSRPSCRQDTYIFTWNQGRWLLRTPQMSVHLFADIESLFSCTEIEKWLDKYKPLTNVSATLYLTSDWFYMLPKR